MSRGVTRVNSGFIFQARRGTELPATGAVLAGSLAACAWLIVSMVLVGRAVSYANRLPYDADADVDAGEEVYAGVLDVTDVFRAAAGALCCMVLFFVAPWPERLMRSTKSFPLVGDVLTPAQHPPNSTRRFFLSALGRGFCAPVYRVRMIDFFLMDQLVSQTTALRDVLTVVFLACGKGEGGSGMDTRGRIRVRPSHAPPRFLKFLVKTASNSTHCFHE